MRIVVSAVNFSEGGPLTVLRDCLAAARAYFPSEVEIIALVHRAALIDTPGIAFIEFPRTKSSWLRRIALEYSGFKRLSRELSPDFWLSLHDISPRLNGERQAVYCHNPVPFFRLTLQDVRVDPTLLAFKAFYSWFYRYNIRSNAAVVVQQEWLRRAFMQRFRAPNVIVAYPDVTDLEAKSTETSGSSRLRLFYPAIARGFKNVELLCEMMKRLPQDLPRQPELFVTISGHENRYARFIKRSYGDVSGLRLIGAQDRAAMARLYAKADVLLFPSRLETWGLPITEAKQFGLPMIVADLPYAHETVGEYGAACFCAADDPAAWAEAVASVASGRPPWRSVERDDPEQPFVRGWAALWRLLAPLPGPARLL